MTRLTLAGLLWLALTGCKDTTGSDTATGDTGADTDTSSDTDTASDTDTDVTDTGDSGDTGGGDTSDPGTDVTGNHYTQDGTRLDLGEPYVLINTGSVGYNAYTADYQGGATLAVRQGDTIVHCGDAHGTNLTISVAGVAYGVTNAKSTCTIHVVANPTTTGDRFAGTYAGTLYDSDGDSIVITDGSFDGVAQ